MPCAVFMLRYSAVLALNTPLSSRGQQMLVTDPNLNRHFPPKNRNRLKVEIVGLFLSFQLAFCTFPRVCVDLSAHPNLVSSIEIAFEDCCYGISINCTFLHYIAQIPLSFHPFSHCSSLQDSWLPHAFNCLFIFPIWEQWPYIPLALPIVSSSHSKVI